MDELEHKKIIIRKDLETLASKLGRAPTQKECKREKGLTYSFNQIMKIYGTYNAAIKDAGLEPNIPYVSGGGHNKISDGDLIQELIRVSNKIGKIPSMNVFLANSKISKKPYQREFGSWANAVEFITSKYAKSGICLC
jgi:hypothetical protein